MSKELVQGSRLVNGNLGQGLDTGLHGKALVKGNGLVGEGLDDELHGNELVVPVAMAESEREGGLHPGLRVDAAEDADGEAHEQHEERHEAQALLRRQGRPPGISRA